MPSPDFNEWHRILSSRKSYILNFSTVKALEIGYEIMIYTFMCITYMYIIYIHIYDGAVIRWHVIIAPIWRHLFIFFSFNVIFNFGNYSSHLLRSYDTIGERTTNHFFGSYNKFYINKSNNKRWLSAPLQRFRCNLSFA